MFRVGSDGVLALSLDCIGASATSVVVGASGRRWPGRRGVVAPRSLASPAQLEPLALRQPAGHFFGEDATDEATKGHDRNGFAGRRAPARVDLLRVQKVAEQNDEQLLLSSVDARHRA